MRMLKGKKTLVRATLTMIGTIVGAGIFGIPAMFEKTGVFVGSVVFWIVTAVILATHLLFVELVVRDPERRRFPGYVGKILGPWTKRFSAVVYLLGSSGANFAYVVLGGLFLSQIASAFGIGIGDVVWQILFWAGGALIVLAALRVVAKIESVLTWLLIAVMLLLIAFAIPQANPLRFVPQHWDLAFVPLGTFIFALFGMMAVPEVHEIAGRRADRTRWAVAIGTIASGILTWLFGVFVFAAVSPGFASDFGAMAHIISMPLLRFILPLIGLLAVITSFITSAFDLQAMIRLDLGQRAWVGRLVTFGIPLVLLFLTARDFLQTIDIVGALFTACDGVIVCIAAAVVMRRDRRRPSVWWTVVTPATAVAAFLVAMVQRLLAFALH